MYLVYNAQVISEYPKINNFRKLESLNQINIQHKRTRFVNLKCVVIWNMFLPRANEILHMKQRFGIYPTCIKNVIWIKKIALTVQERFISCEIGAIILTTHSLKVHFRKYFSLTITNEYFTSHPEI